MTTIDELLGSRTLLVSSHSNDLVLSRTGGQWSSISVRSPRGIAVGQLTAVMSADGAILHKDGSRTGSFAVVDQSSHECGWLADGRLVACSPSQSGLTAYSITGSETVWTVPGVDVGTTDNRSLVNGVSVVDGHIAYVTALGVSNVADGWRDEARASRGVLIDARTGQTVLGDLFFPHTPSPQPDGSVLLLNSGHGQVCRWSSGSTFDVVADLGGWTRGLAMLDATHAAVGVSQGRLTAVAEVTVDLLAQPGIALVDLSSGQKVDFLPLDMREVFSIAVADGPLG